MAHPTDSFHAAHDDLLLWALVVSLALHSAALGLLPGFSFNRVIKTVEPLTVELQQLPPPPVVQPQQPKPQPPKPVPEKPRLEKIPPKPLPQPVTPPPTPVVIPHNDLPPPPPAAVAEPPKPEPPAPAVIAVEQKPIAPPPVFTAPVATPAPQPSEDTLGEVRAAYGRLLKDELARHTRYPPVAAMKGWEGKVKIRLQVDNQGNVIGTPQVTEGSGYKMLDDDAVKTVLKSAPLPLPPLALQDKPIFINTILDYHKAR